MAFDIKWIDRGDNPTQPPNPKYPNGIDLDLSGGMAARVCKIDLPYPARRGGWYIVACDTCRWSGLATTAGRRDDPRSITVPCKIGIVRTRATG